MSGLPEARCVPCFPADLAEPGARGALALAAGFTAEAGATLLVVEDGEPTLLIGCGDPADLTQHILRDAFGAAGRALSHLGSVAVDLAAIGPEILETDARDRAAAEGLVLGGYAFDAHRADRRVRTSWIPAAETPAWRRGLAVAAAVNAARDIVNEPANTATPRGIADHIVALAERSGLGVTVRDEDWLRSQGAGGILAIGSGSAERPLLVELTHEGDDGEVDLCLVGKGVAFDAGGLSLKPPSDIMLMQYDMAGAAAVAHAMSLLPLVAPSLHVRAYLPLVENLPGPNATRPGDIVSAHDGTTIEILNTDFEGRVIMADALSFAAEAHPRHLVDMATLTAGAVNALGRRTAALFGSGPAPDIVARAALATAEAVWPLPMPEHLMPTIRSRVADLKNFPYETTARAGTAAMFLREFVPAGSSWAHIDMGGPGWTDEAYGVNPVGATGWGVRLLLQIFDLLLHDDPREP